MLFLSQTLPFPPDGGVTLRTYNVLRALAGTFDVTGLYFFRSAERKDPQQVQASLEELRRIGPAEAFSIPQEHSRLRFLWDHARSAVLQRAYTEFAYRSAKFDASLRELLRRHTFDIVHVDSLDLAPYLPLVEHLPLACVHHNVESALLRRMAAAEQRAWRRWYLTMQGDLTEATERRWCGRVALNIVVSNADRETFGQLLPSARYVVVPNGVDTDYFRPGPGREHGMVCVGGVHGFTNRDALSYMRREILPIIRSAGEGAPLRWVGRASQAQIEECRGVDGVELTGYVEDVRPLVWDAACYVVPLRVGGGTRVKILDAWAMGKAVVSTPIGCEGLDARDGENILIRDTPKGFADAVVEVLRNVSLRRSLGEAGRETAVRTYSWNTVGRAMVEHYLEIIPPTSRPHASAASAGGIARAPP